MERGRSTIIRFALLGGLIVVLVLALGFLWERRQTVYIDSKQQETIDPGSPESVDRSLEYYAARQESALISFSGMITALGNGCTIDAQCSFTVDGKTVTYGAGVTANGQTGGRSPNMQFGSGAGVPKVGQNVEVKARSYGGGTYTIMNCAECYVKEIAP